MKIRARVLKIISPARIVPNNNINAACIGADFSKRSNSGKSIQFQRGTRGFTATCIGKSA